MPLTEHVVTKVRFLLLAVEVRVQFQDTPCVICDGQSVIDGARWLSYNYFKMPVNIAAGY